MALGLSVVMLMLTAIPAEVSAGGKNEDPGYEKYMRQQQNLNPVKEPYYMEEKMDATYSQAPLAEGETEPQPEEPKPQIIRKGVDISQWNGEINWNQVKAAGYTFAFIRVAYRYYGSGAMAIDEKSVQNLKDAAAAGLDIGAYCFSQAITQAEAIEEANYIDREVKKSGVSLTLPIVIDYEYASEYGYLSGRLWKANLSIEAATNVCSAFLKRAKELGYEGAVYANYDMLARHLTPELLEPLGKIWLAEYDVRDSHYTRAVSYWQYSATGSVAGIKGNVDVNFYYDPPRLASMSAGPIVTIPTPSTPSEPSTPSKPEYYDMIDGKKVTYEPVTEETGMAMSQVNVRKGPATTYTSYGMIDKNTTFTLTGITGDWYRVSINMSVGNIIAYIHKDYVFQKSKLPGSATLYATVQTKTSVRLSWSSVPGASKYRIYKYNTSTAKYEKLKDVTGTTYTDYKVKANKKYQYKVRSIKTVSNNMGTFTLFGGYSNVRCSYTSGYTARVNNPEGVKIYTSTSTDSEVMSTLAYKEDVIYIRTYGDWYKIYFDHRTTTRSGYVQKASMKLIAN